MTTAQILMLTTFFLFIFSNAVLIYYLAKYHYIIYALKNQAKKFIGSENFKMVAESMIKSGLLQQMDKIDDDVDHYDAYIEGMTALLNKAHEKGEPFITIDALLWIANEIPDVKEHGRFYYLPAGTKGNVIAFADNSAKEQKRESRD